MRIGYKGRLELSSEVVCKEELEKRLIDWSTIVGDRDSYRRRGDKWEWGIMREKVSNTKGDLFETNFLSEDSTPTGSDPLRKFNNSEGGLAGFVHK